MHKVNYTQWKLNTTSNVIPSPLQSHLKKKRIINNHSEIYIVLKKLIILSTASTLLLSPCIYASVCILGEWPISLWAGRCCCLVLLSADPPSTSRCTEWVSALTGPLQAIRQWQLRRGAPQRKSQSCLSILFLVKSLLDAFQLKADD